MDTVKIKLDGVCMIAHRGVSGIETENTVPAFVEAGKREYFGVESDIHITADGEYVMIHDDKTRRVSGKNLVVEKSTLEELRNLRLKRKRKSSKAEEYFIPTISEYIEVCKKYGKKCIMELKEIMNKENIHKMIEIIKDNNYLENVIFISFQKENLINLRELLPNQKMQYLVKKIDDEVLKTIDKYDFDLDAKYKALTKKIVDKVHSSGHIVNCWTVNKERIALKMAEMGVDQITTNILE